MFCRYGRGKAGGTGETAERFSVGIASIRRWARRIDPRPHKRRKIRKIDLEKLAQEVRDHPDACRQERAARFDVTPKAIWQALRKPGVTYEKSPDAPESRPGRAAGVSGKE